MVRERVLGVGIEVAPHGDHVVEPLAALEAIVLVRCICGAAALAAEAADPERVAVGGPRLVGTDAPLDDAAVEVAPFTVIGLRGRSENVAEERALLERIIGVLAPAERRAIAVEHERDVLATGVDVRHHARADLLLTIDAARTVLPFAGHTERPLKRVPSAVLVLLRDAMARRKGAATRYERVDRPAAVVIKPCDPAAMFPGRAR